MTLEIIYLAVSELKNDKNNSRVHSAEQITAVANSITEFGFTNPILIDVTNTIKAGHCRLSAAKQLGLETVPCIKLDHLTADQLRAYVIADNQLALGSEWDLEKLKEELEALNDANFNIDLLGFDPNQLNDLLGNFSETDLPDLKTGDRQPFQEMHFVLHDDQVELVKQALEQAKALSAFDTSKNGNSNGNALTRICEKFVKQQELHDALENLLDVFERCEAGFPPEIELRFLAKDLAKAALSNDTNR